MERDGLKLTAYFGERDRASNRFLADALIDVYERHGLVVSAVFRGVEGFGVKHRRQTSRLLTLSEDLPIVSVAVDTRDRVQRALEDVRAVFRHGLITLERARMLTDAAPAPLAFPELPEATKLTVFVGRQERVGGRPAHVAVVELLHRHGLAGATVLLGVDGTAHGVRQRARFFSANTGVPMMIISVGDGPRIGAAASELGAILARPLMTFERVRVCKRDGLLLARPALLPGTDASGLAIWHKLMVFAGEQSRHRGQPLYQSLVRRLRSEGAAGATVLRGVWGYHGAHEPHGDRLWSLRRGVPVVIVLIDSAANIHRWFEIVDELTDETGLVTSEIVPALRATGPDIAHGGLRLAEPVIESPS
jgi:PII-like signaling protein